VAVAVAVLALIVAMVAIATRGSPKEPKKEEPTGAQGGASSGTSVPPPQ